MPTILITGANRGLGLELAQQYGAAGWRVHAACRDPDGASALRVVPGAVTVHRLDVGNAAEIAALAAHLEGEAIDVLMNNAGTAAHQGTSLAEMDYAAWAEVLRINVLGQFAVAAAFVPHVAASQRKLMLFMSSRAGSIGDNFSGGRYIYRSSKAALNAVVKSLAIDLLPKNIVCCAIHPGWNRTDMGGSAAPLDAKTSMTMLRGVIDRLESHNSGRFINYDGQELAW